MSRLRHPARAIVLMLVTLAGTTTCDRRQDARAATSVAGDDFGDRIMVGPRPRRIVSLNPATTELLFAIGAGSRVVGRTHWDVWPPAARRVPDLGPGLRPNLEAVLAARPDLVVLYASGENRSAARALRRAGIATLSIRVDRVADFARVTRLLGAATGDTNAARIVTDTVEATLRRVREETAPLVHPTVFWHVWHSPLVTIGSGSFMTELVVAAGGTNVYADDPKPSVEVSLEDVVRRDPRFVLAGAAGARQIAADPLWRLVPAARAGRVLVIDTALVALPSVRLGEAAVALARLLHPGVIR